MIDIKFGKYQLSIGKNKSIQSELGAAGTTVFSGMIHEEYKNELRGATGMDTYDKMRKGDGMIRAVLSAFELPLRSAEWFVGGDEDTDEKHIEFIKEALFERMSISFDEWLYHVLLFLTFGFSVFEKVFKLEDGQLWWQKLAPRLQKTIYKWYFDENGGLKGLQQFVLKNEKYEYIDIPVEKLLIFTHNREGSNYEGTSVLRSAYKHWFYKDLYYRVAGIGVDRQGVGIPVITAAEGFTPDDKKEGDKILKTLRVNERAGIFLPPGWNLEMLKTELNAAKLKILIDHQDHEIAISVLASFLTLGKSSTGSFALSKDQSDFFMMAMNGVCKHITNVMNTHAIPQLINLNFPNVKSYPKLKYSLGKMDKFKMMEGLKSLVDGQVIIPDDKMEDVMRELLALPEKDSTTSRTVTPKVEAHEHPIRLKEGFWRDLTKWEHAVDFKTIDDKFTQAENILKAEMGIIATKQIDDLLKQIKRATESGKVNELYKLVVKYRGEYAEVLRNNIKELANFGKDMASAETKIKIEKLSRELENWLKIKADTVVELHAAKMKSAAMFSTLNSVNSGESAIATLFNVKTALNNYVTRELHGTASVIVNESINQGRNEIVRSGLIQAAQFSAILDIRTCPLCERLDGRIIDVEDPEFKQFTPPVHQDCRCIWVYIKKEEERVAPDWITPPQNLVKSNGSLI